MSSAQRQRLQAAFRRCGGGNFRGGGRRFNPANNPQFRVQLTRFVACVRQHGYNLPAPNTSGRGPVFDTSRVNRRDPKFIRASQACQSLLTPRRPPAQ